MYGNKNVYNISMSSNGIYIYSFKREMRSVTYMTTTP